MHNAFLVNGQYDRPDAAECLLVRHLVELAMVFVARLHDVDPRLAPAIASILDRRLGRVPTTIGCRSCAGSSAWPSVAWDGDEEIHLNDVAQMRGASLWNGPSDLSADARLFWDPRALYVQVIVTDDQWYPPPTLGRIGYGDSVQLAVAVPGESWMYEYGIAQVQGVAVLGRLSGPPGVAAGKVSGGWATVERRASAAEYRVSIPWNEFSGFHPVSGAELCFGLIVNERDHEEQPRAWMEWTPGLVVERTTEMLGRLRLLD